MATVQVGPLTLHTNAIGWQAAIAHGFGRGPAKGRSYPATVTGPAGLELDLAIFVSDDGNGMVHCPDAAGVPAEYARLSHGARLGVYSEAHEFFIVKQLRLLRFAPETGWGSATLTTWHELDELLGESTRGLFRDLGAIDLGHKSDVLGTNGKDLAMRWSRDSGPELPLSAYTITRVLPIFKAIYP